MDVKLQNAWEYQGDDWWEWSAYLTGEDLGKVDYVEYVLHPTFQNPIRVSRARASHFKMETEGWGEFQLKAIVHFKNCDKPALLTHEVRLMKRPPVGKTG